MGERASVGLVPGTQFHEETGAVFLEGGEVLTGHQRLDLQNGLLAEGGLDRLATG